MELFEPYNSSYITTGEHIYFQVKGTEHIAKGTYKIYEQKTLNTPIKELKSIKKELDYFIENGHSKMAAQTDYTELGLNADEKCWTSRNSSSELSYRECHNAMWLCNIWDQICTCSGIFEEEVV